MHSLLLSFEIPAFLLGLLLGSFLNVCISRLPAHRSIVKPRSHCPRCLAPLRWYDNVPLLSWILLAAKCRHCKGAIPWRYPLVELATGIWFALAARGVALAVVGAPGAPGAANLTDAVFNAIGFAILGFLLLGLAVMDWQTYTLPDAFTYPGIAIGFVIVCARSLFLAPGQGDIHVSPRHSLRMSSPGAGNATGDVFLTGPEHMVFGRVVAICGAALILLGIRWIYKAIRKREGLGAGDVKLIAMIAAFLGFWPAVVALFLGVLSGAVYAISLLVRRRATVASKIPLGTFLAIGGLATALIGAALIGWYSSLL
jgi:leader peptidase (prepilin peptidase)/N-methyltransferase